MRHDGLQPGHLTVRLRGSAGQSLGAFAVQGLKLEVFGDANDYVGKGLSGGTIVVRPMTSSHLVSNQNTIIGNTVLYGATAGAVRRRPGRRAFRRAQFRRRCVVEGCGSNGCEYMTSGTAVILGRSATISPPACMAAWPSSTTPPALSSHRQPGHGRLAARRHRVLGGCSEEPGRAITSRRNRNRASPSSFCIDWDRELPRFWQVVPKDMLAILTQPLTEDTGRAVAGDD